jgi:hypothetical protein
MLVGFEKWWSEEGKSLDLDTEDVPLFDKRKRLLFSWAMHTLPPHQPTGGFKMTRWIFIAATGVSYCALWLLQPLFRGW